MSGWIGVDLDGTLAKYDGWISEYHIGEPVPLMADRVKDWLSRGIDVRIFTARADSGHVEIHPDGVRQRNVDHVIGVIQDWTEKHFGVRLPVTNKKDFGMIQLWDDRAVQVIPNTGIRADGGD